MEKLMDYDKAVSLIRRASSALSSRHMVEDVQGLVRLIEDIPSAIDLIEKDFLPILSSIDLGAAELMDDIMDLGRVSASLLKDMGREGFDLDGADLDYKELTSRYEQISGLHKSAAEVPDSQVSASKAMSVILSALKVLYRNYDRGSRKLKAQVDQAQKGSYEESLAVGALNFFYSSYDRMLRGSVGVQKILPSIADIVRKNKSSSSSHVGIQELQSLRAKVESAFAKVKAKVEEYPEAASEVQGVYDGVWSKTKSLVAPLGLSVTGKYMQAEHAVKTAAKVSPLSELLPKVDTFQDEMLQVLSSARDALRSSAPRSEDIVKKLPGLYGRVLGDLESAIESRHESSGFQKVEGADVQLAATLESLIGEEKRLHKIFNTFQGRAEKLGPSEVKNLQAKSSKWRKDLESRLAEHGLRPNGTVTSDLISKLSFLQDDDRDSLATRKETRIGEDLDGILSDLSAYWKGYVTLLRSGHEDAKKVADGFREAVSGTEDTCLGRHVHRYAQYLKGLVESGAKPTMTGSLPGAAMHMTGVVSSRIVAALKAAPPVVETVFGERADRAERQTAKLGKIMDNETRDALEEVDNAADSLPKNLTAPLDDKPDLNLVDRFLSDNSNLLSRIVDVAMASGYRGDHTNGKDVLLKEIASLRDSLSVESFTEYRKKAEAEASSEVARQDLKAQELTETVLHGVHSALANLVSGGNSMESGVPSQGDVPGSDEIRAVLSGLDAEVESVLHNGDLSGVFGQDEPPRASDIAALTKTLKDLEVMYSGSKLKGGATVAKLPNLYALLTRIYEESGAGQYRLKLFKGIEAAPIHKIDRKPAKEDTKVELTEDRKDLYKRIQTVFGHLSSGDLSLSSKVTEALELKGVLKGLGAAMLSAPDSALTDAGDLTAEQVKAIDEKTIRALDELRSLYAGGRAHSEEDTRIKAPKIAELLDGLVYRRVGSEYQLLSFPAIKAQPARQDSATTAAPSSGTAAKEDTSQSAQETVPEIEAAVETAEKASKEESSASAGKQVFTQAMDVTRRRMRAVQDAMARNRDKAVAKRYQLQLDGLSDQIAAYKEGIDKYDEVLGKISELAESVATLQAAVNSNDSSDLPAMLDEVRSLSKTVADLAKSAPKDPIEEVASSQSESGAKDDKPGAQEASRILSRVAKQLGRVSDSLKAGGDSSQAGKILALKRMAEGASTTLSRYSTVPWEWSSEQAAIGVKALTKLEAASDDEVGSEAGEALKTLFSYTADGAMKLRMYPLVVTGAASSLESVLKGLSAGAEEKLVAPLAKKDQNQASPSGWGDLSGIRSEVQSGPGKSALSYLKGPVATVLEGWLENSGETSSSKSGVEALLDSIKKATEEPVQGNHLGNLLRLPEVVLAGKLDARLLHEELSHSPTKSGTKKIGIGKYLASPAKLFPQAVKEDAGAEEKLAPSGAKEKQNDSVAPDVERSQQLIRSIRESLDSKERGSLGRFIRSEEIESPGKGESLRELVLNYLGVVESAPAAYEDSLNKVIGLMADKQYESLAGVIEDRGAVHKRAGDDGAALELTIKLSWHAFGSGTASPVKVTVMDTDLSSFKRKARTEGSLEFSILDKAFTSMLKSALARGSVPFLGKAADTHSSLFSMLKAYRTQRDMSKPEFLLTMLDIKATPASQLRRLCNKETWESGQPKQSPQVNHSKDSEQTDLFR